ncbi:MAG: sigma-70 family RNA polymerase sigma factor [Aureliella sp.]
MAKPPETRVSLILKLAEPSNVQAWQEFAEIYTPMLLDAARRKGLQPADCEDVAQEILFGVARSVERFKPDEQRARFRTWLWRIARNLIADFIAGDRRRIPLVQGDSWIEAASSRAHWQLTSAQREELEHDLRSSLYRAAAARVRRRLAPATWAAFEATAILGRPAAEVSESTGLSIGAVYVARSRAMKLLAQEVERLSSIDSLSGSSTESTLLDTDFWCEDEGGGSSVNKERLI